MLDSSEFATAICYPMNKKNTKTTIEWRISSESSSNYDFILIAEANAIRLDTFQVSLNSLAYGDAWIRAYVTKNPTAITQYDATGYAPLLQYFNRNCKNPASIKTLQTIFTINSSFNKLKSRAVTQRRAYSRFRADTSYFHKTLLTYRLSFIRAYFFSDARFHQVWQKCFLWSKWKIAGNCFFSSSF